MCMHSLNLMDGSEAKTAAAAYGAQHEHERDPRGAGASCRDTIDQ